MHFMSGYLFRERGAHIIGVTFESLKRGKEARDRLRARVSLLTEHSFEAADAANLGTVWFGTEGWSPEQLLQAARRRFRAASGRGDNLEVDA